MNALTIQRGAWTVVAIVLLPVAVGCGSAEMPIAEVSGRVTVDGKPATEGVIYFVPDRGPSAAGEIKSDGMYQLSTRGKNDGAVVGRHRVYLGPSWPVESGSGMTADVKPRDSVTFPPRSYRTPETSGLSADVADRHNSLDFDLKRSR